MHKTIREHFGDRLDTDTMVDEKSGDKFVRVFARKVSRSGKRKRDPGWPADRPHYVKFTLYKENCDTIEAISNISSRLHLSNKLFSYAGTKDRRAVTAQEVTVFKVQPDRLESVNRTLRHVNLRVGNFSFCDDPLRLGALKGNRFSIVLRQVEVRLKQYLFTKLN